MTFVEQAFEVPEIRHANIRRCKDGFVSGVVTDDEGHEYDVTKVRSFRWKVTDADGRHHRGPTLELALRRAVNVNRFL